MPERRSPQGGRVGIVMRSRDRPLLLRRALRSVLGQTLQAWKLVIINDGGEPALVDAAVAEVREALAGRVEILHQTEHLGPGGALNAGIAALSSEYCVVHDDDDSWHPEFLEMATAFLDSPPLSSFRGVITHSAIIHETIEAETVRFVRQVAFNETMRNVTLYDMAAQNNFSPISFLYRRDVHDEIGMYRRDLPCKEDWDFNLRFLLRYDIGLIPRVLAFYHQRVDLTAGAYANTVVGALDKHDFYEHALRNAWLRDDLRGGRNGLGFLSNFARAMTDLTRFVYSRLEPAPPRDPKG